MSKKNLEDIYPLSPMQQGMLFHSLLAPDSGAYVVQLSYEIHARLNFAAFEQAWQELLNRHSVLRTAFVWENLEKPLQVVGRKVKVSLEKHDWQNLSPVIGTPPLLGGSGAALHSPSHGELRTGCDDRPAAVKQQQQLEALLQQQRQQGFPLAKAPLMRLTLIEMEQEVHQFIWTYHHLLLDGWSVPLLLKEFISLYGAFCQEKNLYLEKPRPYRDYIAWLQQQNLSKAEEYWRNTLKGFTAPTSLGINRVPHNASTPNYHYQEQKIELLPEITLKLQSVAKTHQLTLNTLVQGAWALLLSRYSDEEDIVFGATCSGRPTTLSGSDSMIGLFVNTLPIRVKVNPQQSLVSWLKQLQTQQLERQLYEYSPLIEIQGWSDLPRSLPLFESLLIFQNYPVESGLKQSVETLDIRNIRTTEQTNYPLTVYAVANPQLSLKVLSDSQRFEADAIARMLGHLQTLLVGMVTEPQRCLKDIPLLTEVEKYQLLVEWNDTQVKLATSDSQSIHGLFEARVEKTPDRIAVVFGDEQVTYRELNRRANQLAGYLKKLGVQPETLVGIYVERSPLMLIGLLGILKAGGAYVSLDPSYPQERLAFVLEDAQLALVITQEKFVKLSPKGATKVICLDASWTEIAQEDCEDNPTNAITPDNLAYVIYTSGSTGKPKGVQILHKSLVNFLLSMRQTPGLTPEDVLLSVTTLSFDIAALELYLPLIIGARLVVVSREIAADGTQLLEELATHNVTVMQATPATWRMLVERGWQGNKPFKILCGGEALPYQLAQELLQRGSEVWNLYGPTETTIWSAALPIHNYTASIIPIGRPIANTQFYVLDRQQQVVPIGVPGELYIGGAGLARGYLNRPELTAERFIQWSDRVIALYKTGDRVRYLPDGTLEYLGRLDYQIKLRGFRIELGEIEGVLSQHPAVQENVVVVREDKNDRRIVAYVVPKEETQNLIPLLRRFLEEKLPHYMLPSAYVTLENLSLTPNGKVDRQSLPALHRLRPQLEMAYAVPRTELERKVAAVWRQILDVEQVGIHDNFFDLGGHSLLMVRVHSQLRQISSSEISLIELFKYPTISALVEYCSRSNHESSEDLDESRRLAEGKKRLKQRLSKRGAIRDFN